MHRAFPGWHLVGEVDLSSPDLTGDLALLRNDAAALDPSGIRSKLVIPNDQIKYLMIDGSKLTDEAAEAAVLEALDGVTPYSVDALAYDWSTKDNQIYIAAVARETLTEAQAFTAEHQFNPIRFRGRSRKWRL